MKISTVRRSKRNFEWTRKYENVECFPHQHNRTWHCGRKRSHTHHRHRQNHHTQVNFSARKMRWRTSFSKCKKGGTRVDFYQQLRGQIRLLGDDGKSFENIFPKWNHFLSQRKVNIQLTLAAFHPRFEPHQYQLILLTVSADFVIVWMFANECVLWKSRRDCTILFLKFIFLCFFFVCNSRKKISYLFLEWQKERNFCVILVFLQMIDNNKTKMLRHFW